jgi:hypothetical protein
LYIRTESEPAGLLATVQRSVRELDTRIDVSDVRTIETVIGQSLFGATIGVGLLTLFGFISLALASLGLYGAVAHGVNQRKREIGVRMALGARHASVVRLVLRQGLTPVAIGMALGGVASLVVGERVVWCGSRRSAESRRRIGSARCCGDRRLPAACTSSKPHRSVDRAT